MVWVTADLPAARPSFDHRPWTIQLVVKRTSLLLPIVLAGVGVLALGVAFLAWSGRLPLGGTGVALAGTDLGRRPAPNFALQDADGARVELSAQRGKVVVLTFLYTSCPDICPLTADKLQQAYRQLQPGEQDRVALLAVSVDPEGDTPERRRTFERVHGLEGVLRFLNGDPAELAQVWSAYGIFVSQHEHGSGESRSVGHTAVTYLIDAAGQQRALLGDDEFTPEQLVTSLRVLLREAG